MKHRFLRPTLLILLIITLFSTLAISGTSPDSYEDDDTWQNAKELLTNGSKQIHGFYPAGEVDYVKFTAVAGFVYVVETNNLSDIDITDTMLYLYDTDGTTQITENDDLYLGTIETGVRTSRIVWKAKSNGTYYVKVINWASTGTGDYEIWATKMGNMQPYVISHSGAMNVSREQTFNVTMGLKCQGGQCLNVNAVLDPKRKDKTERKRDKADPKILKLLSEEEEVEVIVMLKGKPDKHKRKKLVRANQKRVLSKLKTARMGSKKKNVDFKVKRVYNTVNGFSGTVTKRGLKKLLNNPNVANIYYNQRVRATLDTSVPNLTAPQLWSTQLNGENITGKGQTICIIDTGINYLHSDFGNCTDYNDFKAGNCRVLGGYDFAGYYGNTTDDNPLDDNGHGSHCAGIAASEHPTYTGMAPEANLIAIKALDHNGSGSTDDIIAGIDWCVNNASVYNISVISMSIGTEYAKYNFHCNDDPETDAINAATQAGITVVIAAGNDGYTDGINNPGCIQNATSVGAIDYYDNYAFFSNRGITMDLVAQGYPIKATDHTGGHKDLLGTSMATPHVAGAAALIQQYARLKFNRQLEPWDVTQKLKHNGPKLYDSGSKHTFTKVRVKTAAQAKGAVPTTPGATPFYTLSPNPHNANCLTTIQDGDTCNQTWIVNATGELNSTWEFFGIYETLYQTNTTPRFNITIVSRISLQPPDGTISITPNINLTCYATHEDGLANITLWHNINGTWQANQTDTVTGTANSTVWEFTDLMGGTYKWSCSITSLTNKQVQEEKASFSIDNYPPLTYLNQPNNNHNRFSDV